MYSLTDRYIKDLAIPTGSGLIKAYSKFQGWSIRNESSGETYALNTSYSPSGSGTTPALTVTNIGSDSATSLDIAVSAAITGAVSGEIKPGDTVSILFGTPYPLAIGGPQGAVTSYMTAGTGIDSENQSVLLVNGYYDSGFRIAEAV